MNFGLQPSLKLIKLTRRINSLSVTVTGLLNFWIEVNKGDRLATIEMGRK